MPKMVLTPESRGTSRDRLQLVIFGIAAIAALTFLGSVVAVLLMHAP